MTRPGHQADRCRPRHTARAQHPDMARQLTGDPVLKSRQARDAISAMQRERFRMETELKRLRLENSRLRNAVVALSGLWCVSVLPERKLSVRHLPNICWACRLQHLIAIGRADAGVFPA
jgi:hypothetical protein